MEIIKIVQDGIELDVNGGEIDASSITQDTDNRFVTDAEKTTWNNKVDKVSGKQLSTNDYTTVEKNKLTGIQAGAQVNAVTSVNGQTGAVTTPNTTYNVATTTTNGLMSSADKVKLDGVEAGAEANTVTSVNGQTGAVTTPNTTYNAATTTTNGLMLSTDKVKLDSIYKMVYLTEVEYEMLETKDPNTLYIRGE